MSRWTERPTADEQILTELLDGRYRIHSLLGRGGMGVVYRALDTRLDRPVAVKLLGSAEHADEARFAAEVRTLARFVHPNLVRILDAGEFEGRPYLVMDLVEGVTLAHRLAAGPLSGYESARIGIGVASALAYVHAEGVVHRDVKPANVLLDQAGEAHLTDFGIARLVDTTGMTATGLLLGTPAYLAPEQILGSGIGPAVDVYALGLVLFECVTGRRAFEGTASEITAARLGRDVTMPRGLTGGWPGLLASMTCRDPELRLRAADVAVAMIDLKEPLDLDATQVLEMGDLGGATLLASHEPVVETELLHPPATTTAWVVPSRDVTATGPRALVKRRALLVAVGIAVVALLSGLVAGGVFFGPASAKSPPGLDPRGSTTTTTTPSTTTTSTTTTSTTVLSAIASSAGAMQSAIQAGLQSGNISPPVAQQLENQLQPLLVAAPVGSLQQQIQQFNQVAQTFNQDVANGLISDPATLLSISSALGALATALGVSVPTTTTSLPFQGPGGGNGVGHGHGHGNT